MLKDRIDTTAIFADLQRRLLTAGFEPGAKLRPSILNAEYGCSANTVRDVLLQLSMIGLVDFEMQRGFRAPAVSTERRAEIATFRVILEQEGAVRSMQRGGLEWETQLAAAHHALVHIQRKLAETDDTMPFVGIWSDGELTFHQRLISHCGLPPLIAAFDSVYMQFRQQMTGLEANCVPGHFTRIVEEHQAIVDAVVARDEGRLRAAIRAHQDRHLGAVPVAVGGP